MSFPLMPLAGGVNFLSVPQAVDFLYNNYASLMTAAQKPSTTWVARTARQAALSFSDSNSTGIFNVSCPVAPGYFDGSTVLFLGGALIIGGACPVPTSTTVNGVAVSLSTVYNSEVVYSTFGTSSCGLGHVPQQPNEITVAQAAFPISNAADKIVSGAIYILPGKWTAAAPVQMAAGVAAIIAISANQVVVYSSGDATDATPSQISVSSGFEIGSSRVNWYEAVEHGLAYRTTSGNLIISPLSAASKIVYSILTMAP